MMPQEKTMDVAQLYAELAHFTGTEAYHQVGFFRRVVCTDGVHFLRQKANCFWLIEAIASYLLPFQQMAKKYGEDFMYMSFWKLRKDGEGVVLEARADSGRPVKIEQKFEYTDFPFPECGEFDIWCQVGGTEEQPLYVLMLSSEY